MKFLFSRFRIAFLCKKLIEKYINFIRWTAIFNWMKVARTNALLKFQHYSFHAGDRLYRMNKICSAKVCT